jgi:heme/copper-type cytochrome/quinol oxidase subunit 3
MEQETGVFNHKSDGSDPGPGMDASFGICFLADLVIIFAISFSNFGSFIGAGGKLPVYFVLTIPLVANGIAIWWASATKRERCLKGLIICTALMVLLDGACFALLN